MYSGRQLNVLRATTGVIEMSIRKIRPLFFTLVLFWFLPLLSATAEETISHTDCDGSEYGTFSDLNYDPEWAKRDGWHAVPILFATDRSDTKNGGCNCFSEKQRSGIKENAIFYGRKTVSAPRLKFHAEPKYKPFFDTLGWQVEEKYRRRNQQQSAELKNLKLTESDFLEVLSALKDKTNKAIQTLPDKKDPRPNDLFVFVHGCCRSFDLHTEQTACLSSWLWRPVISYDWTAPHVTPSLRRFKAMIPDYMGNETNVQRTEDRFSKFLNSVESVYPPEETILVAHSMGNRLVEQALIRRALQGKQKYKEVIFGCADTDYETFANHARLISDATKQVTIYTSMHDQLLSLSDKIHSTRHRLGRMTSDECLELLKTSGRSNIRIFDVTAVDINHDLPIWLIANLYQDDDPWTGGRFAIQMPHSNYYKFEAYDRSRPRIQLKSAELLDKQPTLMNTYQRQLSNVWMKQKPLKETITFLIKISLDGTAEVIDDGSLTKAGYLNYAKEVIVKAGMFSPPAGPLEQPIQIIISPAPSSAARSFESHNSEIQTSRSENKYENPTGMQHPKKAKSANHAHRKKIKKESSAR